MEQAPNEINNLTQPLSKKQLKRMKRQEEWEAKKKELRKQRKERIKEKKKQNANKSDNKPQTASENEVHKTREERTKELIEKSQNGIKIIIDCDFEDLMNDKSINSMSRQVASCYSINRKAEQPFNLILYNVGPKLFSYLSRNHCENWVGITIYQKGKFPSFDEFIKRTLYKEESDLTEIKKKIYYLSADSENELTTLDKDSTYIIGGIVDRNRYKNLSLNKANELKINHGKFPIGEYIKLSSSQVLTTNHTFAILNEFNIKKDWKEAFLTVIPKRKINEGDEDDKDSE